MLKTVIVDDEPWIRKLIIKLLPYDCYPINLCGEASNGLEAIELISEVKPDIIITDIRMPQLSGLDLIERIKKTTPHGQIIIISGYDSFEYAQKAIKLGVIDFVIKPVEKDQLAKAFKRANRAVEKERELLNLPVLERQIKRLERKKIEVSTVPGYGNIKDKKIKESIIFIEENFSKNISQLDVCDYILMNNSYFSTKFKEVVGKGFNTYLTERRLNESTRLLTNNPDLSIKDISSIVGFQDSNYFSRIFKKNFNVTPQEFRDSL